MKHILALLFTLSPTVVAAAVRAPTDFKSFLDLLTGIIQTLILGIFALTFLTVSWGVIQAWIVGDPGEENVERGKKIALAGIIGLVVMSSVWGMVKFLKLAFFGI